MGLVFYNEAVLGRGILYVEPNRFIASVELLMVVVGVVLLGVCMFGAILFPMNPTKHGDEPEPYGYPSKATGAYA